MEWIELSLFVPRDDLEAVADIVRRFAAGGVSIEEPLVDRGDQAAVDVTRPPVLKLYLRRDERLAASRRALRRALSRLPLSRPLPPLCARLVREEDWADAWKRYFEIERIGARIVVCPRWREYEAQPGQIVIRLDPGMAFGTGSHPTTRMCLFALEKRLAPGMRVLDLGTGSGILAIAAAGLGAGSVLALDNDPLAVQVADENAGYNGWTGKITVRGGSLGPGWPLPEPPDASFDLLVANLNAAAVLELAPHMVGCLRKGGTGIIGGVIEERLHGCRRALKSAGARIVDEMADGDWRTLLSER